MLFKKYTVVRELLNTFKKYRLLYEANALVKSLTLKFRRFLLEYKYRQSQRKIESGQIDEKVKEEFRKFFKNLRKGKKPIREGELNIFWVGASKAQDESGFIQALRRFGNVKTFTNSRGEYGPLYELEGSNWLEVRKLNDMELYQQVLEALKHSEVDLILGQMWAHVFSEQTLVEVGKLGIPIINISMDDRLPELWGSRDGEKQGAVGLGQGVHLTLTTAPEVCQWYAVEKMPALFWPLASDETLFADDFCATKDIDVLFIGNRYGIRGKLVQYLKKSGIKVACYGNGWSNGYVNAEENIRLSKKAKIILGVGTVGHCSDVYTLKLRDFDAMMCGGLYITHRNPDLLRIFEEGKHFECYGSFDEAATKIRHYLNNPEACAALGLAGQAEAVRYHSWSARLTKTFLDLGIVE